MSWYGVLMSMRAVRTPGGEPTFNVGFRAKADLFRRITEVAARLNVTKNHLLTAIVDHELSLVEDGVPVWWDEWVNRHVEQQASLIESEGGL